MEEIRTMKVHVGRRIAVTALTSLLGSLVGGAEPPASYLSAGQLLDRYRSMYSPIHNMSLSYEYRQEGTPGPEDPNAFDRLVPLLWVERIEEGDKYHVRQSTHPDGFARPEHVDEYAFDGTIAKMYTCGDKMGSVIRGKTGRAVERGNRLLDAMLLSTIRLPDIPQFRDRHPKEVRRIDLHVQRGGTVRPHLERVAGEWCHVIDSHREDSSVTSSIWLAVEKGGLPLRFEHYRRDGGFASTLEVQQIGTTNTDTGAVWYPKESLMTSFVQYGTVRHKVVIDQLKVNVPTTKDTWDFSFSVGTYVVDWVAGIYYEVGSAETPGGEPIPLGTLPGYETKETSSARPVDRTESSEVPKTTVIATDEEPNQAQVRQRDEADLPPTGRARIRTRPGVWLAICLVALLVGGGVFLWRSKRDRLTARNPRRSV
jgi:hypothetical protein